MGQDTPCETCPKAPPDLDPENALADELHRLVWGARDGMGGLAWAALMSIMDAERLDARQRADVIAKVAAVEAHIATIRAEERKHEADNPSVRR